MIRAVNIGPGRFRFERDWPDGLGIRFELTLTDPDGDKDERIIIWKASKPYNIRTAIEKVIELVEQLPHWRAVSTGDDEIVIGPVEADYAYEVEVSIING